MIISIFITKFGVFLYKITSEIRLILFALFNNICYNNIKWCFLRKGLYMKNKNIKTFSLICVLMLVISISAPLVSAMNTIPQKVRVGWFTFDGVQYIDKNNARQGYCYDYYQEIKKYANFDYDFVHGTWQQCLDRLESGEIDMLSFVHYSPERAELFDFSSEQIGQNYALLSILSTNTSIDASDYSTLNGKTVGVIQGSNQLNDFYKFMSDNNFSCNISAYSSIESLTKALNRNDVDAILHHSMRIIPNNETVIAQFAPERIYIAVKKGNSELLQKIDYALENIRIHNPELNSKLTNSYFSRNYAKNLILTNEEREYLKQLGSLTVIMPPQKGYLAYSDNNQNNGIYYDIMNEISKKLGIPSDYYTLNSYTDIPKIAKNTDNAIFFGFFYDYSWADLKDLYISSPITSLQYYRLQNKERLDVPEDDLKIASIKTLKINQDYILANYTENQITWYETEEECIKAVQKGKQDVTFCNTYTAEYYMKDYHYNKITATLIPYKHDICLATSHKIGPTLSTILSKAISSLSSEYISTVIFNHITKPYVGNTFEKLLYTNPVECIFIAIAVILVLLTIVVMIYINKVNLQKNLALREASAAKTNFLSNMSHEIRTPLNGVKSMLDFLKQRPELENDHQLNSAILSVNHLTGLINDILDMSKIESKTFSLKPVLTSYSEIHEYINSIITPLAKEKNINYTSDIQPCKFKYIYADAGRLKQILINLLSNAVKYTNDNGSVHFGVEIDDSVNNTMLFTFTVADTGIGMSEEFIKRAFDPFEQESRSRFVQGTGLGLSITKSLVDIMNGSIDIHSEVGIGTTITVKLKIVGANSSDLEESEKDIYNTVNNFDNLDLSEKRALIVEDNELNMEIAQIQLTSMGLSVESASNGSEAVEMFNRSPEGYYDIIFMDIMMPVMDGLTAAKEIRALPRNDAPTVPIVAMTANAFVEDIHKSLENGMNYHLSKPFEVSQMKEILARVFLNNNSSI